jgi:hypothetical protein
MNIFEYTRDSPKCNAVYCRFTFINRGLPPSYLALFDDVTGTVGNIPLAVRVYITNIRVLMAWRNRWPVMKIVRNSSNWRKHA